LWRDEPAGVEHVPASASSSSVVNISSRTATVVIIGTNCISDLLIAPEPAFADA
jgi:hypothetical protein